MANWGLGVLGMMCGWIMCWSLVAIGKYTSTEPQTLHIYIHTDQDPPLLPPEVKQGKRISVDEFRKIIRDKFGQ